jgi:hypothetical protein
MQLHLLLTVPQQFVLTLRFADFLVHLEGGEVTAGGEGAGGGV